MSLQILTQALYDTAINAASFAILDKTGLVDKVISSDDDMMASLNLGTMFTISQQIGDYFIRGRPTVIQTGNLIKLLDDVVWNSVAVFGASSIGVDGIVRSQVTKLPVSPEIAAKLAIGTLVTGADITRNILDSYAANSNPMIHNLTHPVYAASGMLAIGAPSSSSNTYLLQ